MAEPPSPAVSSSTESPAQEKARLRRERRAAKIQSGGASRLQAISSLQGGTHRDVEKDVPRNPSTSSSPAPAASPAAGTATPDPEEIDISTHHYNPVTQPRLPSPFAYSGNSPPPFAPTGQSPDPQDPMMAILQQMMGGAGGIPSGPGQSGQPGQAGGLPPSLADMLGAMPGGAAPEPSPDQSSAWIWRLIHALFSLGLAIYIVWRTPFNGSKLSRTVSSPDDADWMLDSTSADTFKHFFYMFATFEVVLQTSRYYIEKGQLQGSGILSSVAQFLPEPYGGYIRLVGRYSVIYSTVVSDAMVLVFVLGAASWLRGEVVA